MKVLSCPEERVEILVYRKATAERIGSLDSCDWREQVGPGPLCLREEGGAWTLVSEGGERVLEPRV